MLPPRRSLWTAAVIAALCALPAAPAFAQSICGNWTRVATPNGATTSALDVCAASADDAWAITYSLGLIRWDGANWNQSDPPDFGGETFWYDTMCAIGPSHLFMAGVIDRVAFANDQALVIRDEAGWGQVETLTLEPDIMGGARSGAANAVGGASIDDVWIVGTVGGAGNGVSNPVLTVHWDGNELVEYWTEGVGNRQNHLNAVSAVTTSDVWAVGHYNNTGIDGGVFHGMTLHWDGSSWSTIPNPSQTMPMTYLRSVAAISSNDVWAGGDQLGGALFMHWDGSAWTIVPAPAGAQGTIFKMVAIATDDVWAVDWAWNTPFGRYYHWDGTAWSIVTPPAIPGATTINRHGGLAAVGECDVWAVGSGDFGSGLEPFFERLQAGSGVTAAPVLGGGVVALDVSPNPLRDSAEIRFVSPGQMLERARIYDVRGQLVRTLLDGATRGVRGWDARDDLGGRVPAGVYFLRAESTDGQVYSKKLTVIR